MIIHEIYIDAFGQFKDKKISFRENLNIIYGENESGKSTIHKFIEGMLFGFFKAHKSRRSYSGDYFKYLPLSSSTYGGSIIYSQNGKTLRLERNLLKGEDKVNIYDNITGADITEEFYYDDAVRLYVPFFANEMNRHIFKNTISIEQLGSRTSTALAGEVSNKLINYAQTKSEISIEDVLNNLRSKLSQLGTARRKNTPIYELETAIEALRTEKGQAVRAMDEVDEYNFKRDKLKKELEESIFQRQVLENNKKAIEYFEAQSLKNEYDKMQIQVKELDEDLLRIKKDYPLELYKGDSNLEEVKNISKKFIELCKDKERLHIEKKYILNSPNKDIEDKIKNRLKGSNLQLMLISLTGILGVVLGVISNPYFYLLAFVFPLGIKVLKDKKNLKENLDSIGEQVPKDLLENLKSTEEEIDTIKDNYGFETEEETIYFLEGLESYHEIKGQQENIQYLMEKTIPISGYSEMNKKSYLYKEYQHYHIKKDTQELNEKIEGFDKLVEERKLELSKLEGYIENTINRYPNISDIENELVFLQKNQNKLRNKQKSINLAVDTIEELSANIHRDFAPGLNRAVGEVLNIITKEYKNIKVDENLSIKVESNKHRRLLDLSKLSKGTIDQIYFAFRIALIDILDLKSYPILLDEPFILYDDNRLKNTISFFKDKQILLFSSQKREIVLLDQMNTPYNLIDLQ